MQDEYNASSNIMVEKTAFFIH